MEWIIISYSCPERLSMSNSRESITASSGTVDGKNRAQIFIFSRAPLKAADRRWLITQIKEADLREIGILVFPVEEEDKVQRSFEIALGKRLLPKGDEEPSGRARTFFEASFLPVVVAKPVRTDLRLYELQPLAPEALGPREEPPVPLSVVPELAVHITNLAHSAYSLSFSPDNVFLAAGTGNGDVIILGPSRGTQLRTLQGHSSQVYSVSYAPKGILLASGASDRTVILRDADLGIQRRMLAGHAGAVTSVAFSPRDAVLASGSKDHRIILWNVNGADILHMLEGHSGGVNSVSFSPQGHLLASGSDDRTIIVWSMSDYQKLYTLTGHSSGVNRVVISPDGAVLASGSSDGSVILWDPANGQQICAHANHTSEICGLSLAPDSTIMASASTEGKILLWDIPSREPIVQMDTGLKEILGVAFSNPGVGPLRLAASSNDGTLWIWIIKQPGSSVREVSVYQL